MRVGAAEHSAALLFLLITYYLLLITIAERDDRTRTFHLEAATQPFHHQRAGVPPGAADRADAALPRRRRRGRAAGGVDPAGSVGLLASLDRAGYLVLPRPKDRRD